MPGNDVSTWFSEASDWWKYGVGVVGGVVASSLALWRIFVGYYVVNLSIGLELQRTPIEGAWLHDLVTTIKLEKGKSASVRLERIDVVVRHNEGAVAVVYAPDINTDLNRLLNLAAEEKTQFAAYSVVPFDKTCEVVVTIAGRSLRPMRLWPAPGARWRASAVSVPQLAKAKDPTKEKEIIA